MFVLTSLENDFKLYLDICQYSNKCDISIGISFISKEYPYPSYYGEVKEIIKKYQMSTTTKWECSSLVLVH